MRYALYYCNQEDADVPRCTVLYCTVLYCMHDGLEQNTQCFHILLAIFFAYDVQSMEGRAAA